jgi:hypothetical protein
MTVRWVLQTCVIMHFIRRFGEEYRLHLQEVGIWFKGFSVWQNLLLCEVLGPIRPQFGHHHPWHHDNPYKTQLFDVFSANFKTVSCTRAVSLYRRFEREHLYKERSSIWSCPPLQVPLIAFVFSLLLFVASKSNLVFTLSHFLYTTSHVALSIFSTILGPHFLAKPSIALLHIQTRNFLSVDVMCATSCVHPVRCYGA